MTKIANVVIGAGYGDEGKGLMTDYLSHTFGPDCVVRFNGGSQAGHTVQTPDGRRHVFGHFGSGTLAGVPTLLSRFFVVNPMLFAKEARRLNELVDLKNVNVMVDHTCKVTTPYDILINQMVENRRGLARHGSCGVGFGETIERDHYIDLRVGHLDEKLLRDKLDYIRTDWFPKRCRSLDIDMEDVRDLVRNEHVIENYVQDVRRMLDHVMIVNDSIVLKSSSNVVFEGAQGLMLDQDYGTFPHVTRSNTGLKNAAALCMATGFEDVRVTYMTRCYATRHGAGPLQYEQDISKAFNVVDETNQPHDFQGTLRFAPLDVSALKDAIYHDLKFCPLIVKPRMGITCLDQIRDFGMYVDNDGAHIVDDGPELAAQINKALNFVSSGLRSYGPTRQNVGYF